MTRSCRAVLWTRVSTDEQHTETQAAALRTAAAARGYEIVREFHVSMSAWKPRQLRKSLDGLFEYCRRDGVNVVMVTALDRITREGAARMMYELDRFESAGIRVVSLREDWLDVPDWMRPVLQALFAGLAKLESDVLSARTKAGMKTARERGVVLGRPDLKSGVDLEFVQAARARGESWDKIAKTHPRTVRTPAGGHARPSRDTIRRAAQRSGQ